MASEHGWMVTAIIFIILFVLMSSLNIYLCILREARNRHVRIIRQPNQHSATIQWDHERNNNKPWYGGEGHI